MTVLLRTVAAALLAFAGLSAPVQADPFGIIQFHSYKLDNRTTVVFPPPPKEGSAHMSPFPSSKRAAAVWESDFCWRKCTGDTSWRYDACMTELGKPAGLEVCRARQDTDNRACLRDCRTRGGPMLNLAF